MNKTGEDDPHLYHYPHRLRTDTASSGSDHQSTSARPGPVPGRLLRSMTFTAVNNLDDESSFASSSMAQVPLSPAFQADGEMGSSGSTNYAKHPLAQSDPSLQLSMPSRRPSLKPGFGMFLTSPRSNHYQHERNTLYHAPSNNSLYSEAPSSIYSNTSLNSSMDTMALSSSSNYESVYGSSFASTTSGFSALNDRKRSIPSLGDISNGPEHNTAWRHGTLSDLHNTSSDNTSSNPFGIPSTPSTANDSQAATDYFSTFTGANHMDTNASTPKETMTSTTSNTTNHNNNNKRPYPGDINSSAKPPLHKSYTFDAISTSPTKKYMRMDDNWSSSSSSPFFSSNTYANGIRYSGGISAGMMLGSPFEMDFGTQNQKNR